MAKQLDPDICGVSQNCPISIGIELMRHMRLLGLGSFQEQICSSRKIIEDYIYYCNKRNYRHKYT